MGKEMITFRSLVSGEIFRTNMREYKVQPSAYIRDIRGSNF